VVAADTLEAGEIRTPKKESKIPAYQGDVIVLEVHDEPRVDWTNEPTCLVKEGKQKPFVHTQANVLRNSDPALDEAGNKRFTTGSML
jgi:hypothetical protein